MRRGEEEENTAMSTLKFDLFVVCYMSFCSTDSSLLDSLDGGRPCNLFCGNRSGKHLKSAVQSKPPTKFQDSSEACESSYERAPHL
jgi:hypothetical protein